MDEAILSSVAGSIMENLGSAAYDQVGSLWNVEDDLEQIRKTVSTIKAVLQDAAEEQNHDNQDRVWLEKLKEAVFDADDLLDESKHCTELALRQKETSGSFTEKVRYFLSLISVVFGRPKMSLKISKLSQELDAIAKDREKFHRKERSTVKRIEIPNGETLPWLPNNGVIGREDEKNQIINRLLEPNNEENVLVVAIVGIAGIGKTTLAQCVYNDDRVDTQFELKLSLCVSNVSKVKAFAKKLVNGIDKDDSIELRLKKRRKFNLEVHNNDPLRKLVNKIYQKKFLVVLDDLWNKNCKNWTYFKSLLNNGANGSRIIITTRDKSVVNITSADATYFLEGLSKDHSWSLFEKLAFAKSQDTKNPTLVDYGREIVDKCQGVPLVLKSVGNVLHSKKPHEWSKIRDKVVKNVNVIEQGGNTLSIIRLSYDNLPSYLKCCFAFFSLFPKDYEIEKRTMTQLWMAHGFIQLSNDTQQVEDVADKYFEDLLCNFLEKRKKIHGFGGLNYKMHDLYHELALSIAGADYRLDYLDEKTRHVSFFKSSFFTKTISLVKASNKVRTILFPYGSFMNQSTLTTLIESFPRLRALDLHASNTKIIPNSIGKLIHLRYLDFSSNRIKTLPDSITTLLNLQTLKLECCYDLEQLPRDITKLVNLRHLDNWGCFELRLPQGLRKLTGLQSLPLFIARNNVGLGELNGLNNLKGTLLIEILEQLEDTNLDCNVKILREKQHLEHLELSWRGYQGGHDEMLLDSLEPHPNLKSLGVSRYSGVTFSSWFSSMKNLVKIEFDRCDRCNHLPPLFKLPFLEILWLRGMKDLECISDGDISEEVSTLSFFLSLKSLSIWSCPNLKGWWRSASMSNHQQHQHNRSLPSFPCLSSLVIENCPNMISMPLFPYQEATSSFLSSHLSKLKYMEISNLPDVSLPHGWASNLIFLERLDIAGCKELNIGSDVDGMEWRHLNRLISLQFSYLPKLNSLPVGLQHITTLEHLFIGSCENLKTLPRWIGNLIPLKCFRIYNCLNLKSLPDEMRDLSSLQTLQIHSCPELRRRCEKETGQDWDKIAHITDVDIL